MKISDLNGKKILILGYGVEGKSTHKFLLKYVKAKKIGIADKNINGQDYLKEQDKYDLAIKSPGIHKSKLTIPYTTATNIFFANTKGFTVAVTGSKGKSTTTALIYHILNYVHLEGIHTATFQVNRVVLAGNITHTKEPLGQPLLHAYDKTHDEQTIYICELSSFQLDDFKYSPDISVFTSFFPEHMDFHRSMENYWNAKQNIAAFSNKENFFVYNPEFPKLVNFAQSIKAKAIPYIKTLPFTEKNIPLIGRYNIDNVKAAFSVSKILNIPVDIVKNALVSFKPLPHRLENIGAINGITFYDDAISTTPQSTIHAIESLKKIDTLMLGGQDRGYDFSNLIDIIIRYKIPNLIFFPDSGKTMLNLLKLKINPIVDRQNLKINILETSSMEEAVKFAYKNSRPDTIVLLSTASPSYSLWKNFEEKGNLFKEEVNKLKQAIQS